MFERPIVSSLVYEGVDEKGRHVYRDILDDPETRRIYERMGEIYREEMLSRRLPTSQKAGNTIARRFLLGVQKLIGRNRAA